MNSRSDDIWQWSDEEWEAWWRMYHALKTQRRFYRFAGLPIPDDTQLKIVAHAWIDYEDDPTPKNWARLLEVQ